MEETTISTVSRQYLVVNDELNHSGDTEDRRKRVDDEESPISRKEWITVIILFFVNLINYMDRYTIAGVLDKVMLEFKLSDKETGLFNTAFIVSYMIFAPLFGYLGDRYNRKLLMSVGVFIWCLTTFVGSFMKDYYYFMAFRALVGIGEASYSTIAPTIISDLFVKDRRSKMLALFYFAIPVGSGLGYITGNTIESIVGDWRWGLRITPPLGILAIFLIFFFVRDPLRGEKEGESHIAAASWSNDIKALSKNPSFMLSTLGFTCVSFVSGSLAFWAPTVLKLGIKLQPETKITSLVGIIFGVITMISGIFGVPFGSFMAQKLRATYRQADPLICAAGLLISAPLIFFSILTSSSSWLVCFVLIFFGQLAMNLNWSIVADMLLYVVIPTRRSTAEAFQILVSHTLGDAGSPWLIGVISDELKPWLRPSMTDSSDDFLNFRSLQYALFITIFVEVLGSLFFFLTALHIERDKNLVDLTIAAKSLETKNNGKAESTRL